MNTQTPAQLYHLQQMHQFPIASGVAARHTTDFVPRQERNIPTKGSDIFCQDGKWIPSWASYSSDVDMAVINEISENVDLLSKRTDEEFVNGVFRDFSSGLEARGDPKECWDDAIKKLTGTSNQGLDFDDVLKSVDMNDDGKIDSVEFMHYVNRPTKVGQWLKSIEWSELIACGFSSLIRKSRDDDPLRVISECTHDHIKQACLGISEGLFRFLAHAVDDLKKSFELKPDSKTMTDEDSKFQFIPVANCGKVEDFYKGLGSRVGAPNPKFMLGMENEHQNSEEFTSSNYNITTTPRHEWELVLDPSKATETDKAEGRVFRNIEDLVNEEATKEGLRREEIIATVLYTGPMFQLYNTALRRWPENQLWRLENHNFATTIHCLVSAVTKLSRRTKFTDGVRLFRGIGGVRLPECFGYRQIGERGMVEWGFMSTTSEKMVALHYTGAAAGRALPTILSVRPASVDHGADISSFSQFPGEQEYLWNPCSLLEPWGEPELLATKHGLVRVLPVRINLNVRTKTVEEIINEKRNLHLSSFRFLFEELKQELLSQARDDGPKRGAMDLGWLHNVNLHDYIERILRQVHAVYYKHSKVSPTDYNDHSEHRKLVLQMLDAKEMAASKLRLWLQDPSQHLCMLHSLELREAHRMFLLFRERKVRLAAAAAKGGGEDAERKQAEALEVCKIQGIVRKGVEETNSLGEARVVRATAEGSNLRVLQLLVDAGANINSADRNGRTPLQWVSLNGCLPTVEQVIRLGGNLLADPVDGWTPMMSASLRGQKEVLQLLFDRIRAQHGEEAHARMVDWPFRGGLTTLWFAALGGSVAAVQELLDRGARVDGVDHAGILTPVMAAAMRGHLGVVQLLHKNKADLNRRLNNGLSALTLAAVGGHTNAVMGLVKLVANPAARDVQAGELWLGAADLAKMWGHQAVVDQLATEGLLPLPWVELGHFTKVAASGAATGRHGLMNESRLLSSGTEEWDYSDESAVEVAARSERLELPRKVLANFLAQEPGHPADAASAQHPSGAMEERQLAPILLGIVVQLDLLREVVALLGKAGGGDGGGGGGETHGGGGQGGARG